MPRLIRRPKRPFRKVLIANRGEIANRIIRTCRRLRIKTVAVYSEADASALHVKQANEAVLVGPAPPAESYLNIDAIIQAAINTGAEAVHPGYGFLSENSDFVSACEEAGLQFIGPSAQVMERMKDKMLARKLATEAGLPVLPGTEGEVSGDHALEWALEIGFPIMVKAAFGGGGIGIRVVQTPNQLQEGISRAQFLAQGAFGNAQLYLEKYLEEPSHVEVQVVADHHGNALHLFERDCSVQRRNQKVIEETPCIKLSQQQRKAMYSAALALVRHIGYTNAGTVEFLIDRQGNFFFVEMNTRIQVEHAVTEMVTGIDLVEWQLRIAAGKPLPLSQGAVRSRGHAIEARIYPEDPATLLPTTGTLGKIKRPKRDHVRIDGGVFQGYQVLPHYDSLMSKVIAWGGTREEAIDTLTKALSKYHLPGVTTNIPLIQRVLSHRDFTRGAYSTLSLPQLAIQGPADPTEEEGERETVAALAAAFGSMFGAQPQSRSSPWKTYGRAAQMNHRPGGGGRW